MIPLHKEGLQVLSEHIQKSDIVVVAPLNWGLGHATRCIPLIQYLVSHCKEVIIASDGLSLKLLTKEFPTLKTYVLPSYEVNYKYPSMILNMILQGPSIFFTYLKELKVAKKIASETLATVIVSDNRFGFRAFGTKNFYITHQVNILHPTRLITWISSSVHRYFIDKFDQCWIPDFAGERSLSGKLSESSAIKNVAHLGPLTRIENKKSYLKWEICILLSGPEPQRTVLENTLIDILPSWNTRKILMIRGTENTNPKVKQIPDNCTIIDLADSSEISDALHSSRLLIARSGYTTVMDIAHLDLKAIFIPTPGQTEQEYLAKALTNNPKYSWVKQIDVSSIGKVLK